MSHFRVPGSVRFGVFPDNCWSDKILCWLRQEPSSYVWSVWTWPETAPPSPFYRCGQVCDFTDKNIYLTSSIVTFSCPPFFVPAEERFHKSCHCPKQVQGIQHLIQFYNILLSSACKCFHLNFILLVWAADCEGSLDREVSLELIRYLVPAVFKGPLLDSLSGHILSAADLAASFKVEGQGCAQITVPPTSICSVIKAQQPGWSLAWSFYSCAWVCV